MKSLLKAQCVGVAFRKCVGVQRRFFPFSQPIIDSDGNEHHKEIFTRAQDNQGALIRATVYSNGE